MFNVNIYIETDGGGAKKRYRTYAAIVEFITKNGEPVTRAACGTEKATGNRIMLLALAAALGILKKPCEVTVYMDCPYVTENIRRGRMYEWQENGWKTIRGEPTANREEWEEITRLIKRHQLAFAAVNTHSYRDRLQYDIRKIKEQDLEWQQQKLEQQEGKQ